MFILKINTLVLNNIYRLNQNYALFIHKNCSPVNIFKRYQRYKRMTRISVRNLCLMALAIWEAWNRSSDSIGFPIILCSLIKLQNIDIIKLFKSFNLAFVRYLAINSHKSFSYNCIFFVCLRRSKHVYALKQKNEDERKKISLIKATRYVNNHNGIHR